MGFLGPRSHAPLLCMCTFIGFTVVIYIYISLFSTHSTFLGTAKEDTVLHDICRCYCTNNYYHLSGKTIHLTSMEKTLSPFMNKKEASAIAQGSSSI